MVVINSMLAMLPVHSYYDIFTCTLPMGVTFNAESKQSIMPFNNVLQVFPVPTFVDDSSGAVSESDRLQRMKDRITQMEKDMRSTYALAAIIKKKSELAADVERYVLAELHRATESLNCKPPCHVTPCFSAKYIVLTSLVSFASHSSEPC